MRRCGLALTAALFTAWGGGAAGQNAPATGCADPSLPAAEAARLCTLAIDSGRLTGAEEARARANRGGARLDLGQPQGALMDFEAAIGAAPTLVEAETGRARALRELGRIDEALAAYAAALRLRPGDRVALMGRGALALGLGDAERALEDFDAVARRDPRDVDAIFNRGVARLRLGRTALAADDFSAVLRLDPTDADAHVQRARARMGENDALAAADLGRAIALRPESGLAYFERGRLYDRIGRIEDANSDLSRAYELGFQDPWLTERVQRLGR